MPLRLKRNEGESWKEALLRAAEPFGLEVEVLDIYDEGVSRGSSEESAAWVAAYEWDLLEFVDEAG